ncbi:MAG: transcriptional repressor [Oscillatoriales cyanobacterium SM2_1_8]|nr:transcriptional repressor [Oscillatoriales cyanobacterium SM2_1_8]
MDEGRLKTKGTGIPTRGARSLGEALAQCQRLGMRLSRQRRFILELLWETGEHLSAKEIYDRLRQGGKDIGHTSVYQNLDALAANGIVERLDRADGCLYGSISDWHSHVRCEDTGRIFDVLDAVLPPDLVARVEAQTHTQIYGYRIEFLATEKLPEQ